MHFYSKNFRIRLMKQNFNPYAKKSHTNDYGTYFNLLYYYVENFNEHPNVYDSSVPIKKPSFENLEKIGAKKVFVCESERLLEDVVSVNETELCYEYKDALVYLCRRDSLLNRLDYLHESEDDSPQDEKEPAYRCKILYQNKETLDALDSCLIRDTNQKKRGNVHLLCSMEGMLALQRFDIKLPTKEIDLALNYGTEATGKFEKIIDYLGQNKNGLVLFSGDPGTGKSTFIKYLTTKTTRKVIYLSSAAIEQLTNPDFLSFIMGHRNSILLLEDAEKALRSRTTQDNDAISNILNITDGILGDCLNITVIATFNIEREKIDSALVRKGRLLMEHYFKALSAEESNVLLEKIGSSRRTSDPMTLAEIYNEEGNFHEDEEIRKVGF